MTFTGAESFRSRSYMIRLTPAGQRAHRAAAELFRPLRSRVEQVLGAKEAGMREALLTLTTVLDGLRRSPAGGAE